MKLINWIIYQVLVFLGKIHKQNENIIIKYLFFVTELQLTEETRDYY